MSQTVTLYGGPLHGQTRKIEHDGDDIEILSKRDRADTEGPRAHVPTRRGYYSRVGDSETEFEWDGWQS